MSAPQAPSGVELVKQSSRHLRGRIVEELALETPGFSKETVHILKFHGTYQQGDRDIPKGQPVTPGSMVRVGVPGGVLTAPQYLALDALADQVGDGGLRLTSRQDIQFHRVRKANLRTLLRALDRNFLSTLAACGDVVRNVTCCPAPFEDPRRDEIQEYARTLARRFKPATRAYFEIWLDGEKAAAAETAPGESEPLYGDTYLPRKFKIGFAAPGDNCIDVYTNDIGIVPVYGAAGPTAFTVLAGGGLGTSPGIKATHPRLADPICTAAPEELAGVVEAVIGIHRDFGNRSNRKLARLKYVLDEWGLERFQAELAERLGRSLTPPQPLAWQDGRDHLGWHAAGDGHGFLGVPLPAGRVRDGLRTALREVVGNFGAGVRLTAQQNLLLTGLRASDRQGVEDMLHEHGVRLAGDLPPVVRQAMACPAFPTCGLAITEAERALPAILADIQGALAESGLEQEPITMRITGCPNGCARSLTAELGLVGQSVALYGIYLGGSPVGTRLAALFAVNVPREKIAERLRPVFQRFRDQRQPGEAFGDFCHRAGVTAELA